MVRDNWRNCLEDAEDFLEVARQDAETNRVRMTNLIHAVIRANDAVLLAYGRDKPSSHEEAASIYTELVDSIGLYEKFGRYEKSIRDILREKTPAEYTGKRYREDEVEKYLKQAERFLDAVRDLIDRKV